MDTAPPPPVIPSAAPQKSGSGKKWVLFGCGGCLGLLILTAIIGWFAFSAVVGMIKSSDAYQTALKRTQASPEVQAALGTPIKEGFMMTGSIATNNGVGTADFSFPITGPKGEGNVIAKASKSASGPWEFSTLQVKINGRDGFIDLNGSP
jgi:hypothetical protein